MVAAKRSPKSGRERTIGDRSSDVRPAEPTLNALRSQSYLAADRSNERHSGPHELHNERRPNVHRHFEKRWAYNLLLRSYEGREHLYNRRQVEESPKAKSGDRA